MALSGTTASRSSVGIHQYAVAISPSSAERLDCKLELESDDIVINYVAETSLKNMLNEHS